MSTLSSQTSGGRIDASQSVMQRDRKVTHEWLVAGVQDGNEESLPSMPKFSILGTKKVSLKNAGTMIELRVFGDSNVVAADTAVIEVFLARNGGLGIYAFKLTVTFGTQTTNRRPTNEASDGVTYREASSIVASDENFSVNARAAHQQALATFDPAGYGFIAAYVTGITTVSGIGKVYVAFAEV